MDWVWFTTIGIILLVSVIFCRLSYLKGYRKGALVVLGNWKETLKEGTDEDDELV